MNTNGQRRQARKSRIVYLRIDPASYRAIVRHALNNDRTIAWALREAVTAFVGTLPKRKAS